MEDNFNVFKNIGNLIPFIGAFFILYGAVYLFGYYHKFNIEIIHYISFTELIIYFIKDIVLLLFLTIFAILFVFIVFRIDVFNSINSKSTVNEKLSNEENLEILKLQKSRLTNYKKKLIFKVALFFGGWIALVIIFWIQSGTLMAITVFTPIFLLILFHYFIKNFTLFAVLYFFFSFSISSYIRGIIDANELLENGNSGYEFKVGDKVFKSDSVNYFIGKTENYIFYYESNVEKTTIYPSDKIEYLIVPNK